ncbi:lamin tail domain-containing protein [Microlunatus ginsengisoli]|uniref:LTD domain-containing protein n=1 Tax=Microlunatus ginsengisoli TaxID=363863 RepID=A0ABP7AIH6_9ACTN
MKVARLVASMAAASVLAAGALATPAEAASPKVQITRVYVNAPGPDGHTNKSVNGEYVRIKNKGKKSVSLKGYTLRDRQHHVYTFGTFTLKPGKTVTVHTGKGKNTSGTLYMGRGWHIWNNSGGDSATLKNAGGGKVDSCSWKTVRSYKTC